MLRDLLIILFVTCSTLGSQLLIKSALLSLAGREPAPAGLDWLLAVLSKPQVWAAITVQGVGFLAWLVVVSRVKLGPAFAISGAFFYVLLAAASWVLYGERLALLQWAGIVCVSVGVLMIVAAGQSA